MRAAIIATVLVAGGLTACDRLFPYSSGGPPSGEGAPLDASRPLDDRPSDVSRRVDVMRDGHADALRPDSIRHGDSRPGDSRPADSPACTLLPPPALQCPSQLGCFLVCTQSNACCSQVCGGTGATSPQFSTLYNNCVSSTCGTACKAYPRANCLACIESSCTSQVSSCINARVGPYNCPEWLACVLSCKGGGTPGVCVASCTFLAESGSLQLADGLKLCGESGGCKGCVDASLGSCDTSTLLGCLQKNCTGPLETCWKDYK